MIILLPPYAQIESIAYSRNKLSIINLGNACLAFPCLPECQYRAHVRCCTVAVQALGIIADYVKSYVHALIVREYLAYVSKNFIDLMSCRACARS